ncbi:MAG: NAD(+)/NADH kinase [Paraclostridium sp.]|uniref:NAD(+)/NADH kinase n=1 Tax=Paraclostridium sp. TaxID=2023273 RepID=UPI003F31F5DE
MDRIITVKSNELDKSIKIKQLLKKKLITKGFKVIDYLHEDTELIVSIGGDGSFLKTINNFDFPKKLFVGINTGHLGFFPDVSIDEIDEFIDLYMENNYLVQEIPILMATIVTNDNTIRIPIVNEVVIKCDKSKVIHAKLNINGKQIQKLSGDGLIISTPTGSTAYNYSARGSIVDPSINVIQITPLNPLTTNAYRSFSSSLLFSAKSVIEVTPENRFEKPILIVADGEEYKFDKLITIKTHMTNRSIKLIRMPNYEFWNRVSNKFL